MTYPASLVVNLQTFVSDSLPSTAVSSPFTSHALLFLKPRFYPSPPHPTFSCTQRVFPSSIHRKNTPPLLSFPCSFTSIYISLFPVPPPPTFIFLYILNITPCVFIPQFLLVESRWNVMAHDDAREGKWRGKQRMKRVASTLHTTSEHGASSITTADTHTSAASSRLNWRPRRFNP